MKVARAQNGNIVLRETAKLHLNGCKGAIVEVICCGLCGSDIVKIRQDVTQAVLGHEIVAQIVEIDSDTDFKVGDEIVTSHHVPCGQCEFCKNGNVSMCRHFKETNIEPGGFSEYVYVSDEHLKKMACLKPAELSYDEATFYEPLGCCVRAIRRGDKCIMGGTALVIGLGSIGIIMAQALRAYGVNVTGVDLLEERMNLLKKYGINTGETANVDAVFMTSGSDKAIETALKSVRDGGKIVVFSSTPQNSGYANNEIYYRELTVMGSYSPGPEDLKESLELLESGKVNVKGLSTEYTLENIEQAFEDAVSNKVLKACIRVKT